MLKLDLKLEKGNIISACFSVFSLHLYFIITSTCEDESVFQWLIGFNGF